MSVRLVTPLGTTSACAENTHRRRTAQPGWRNYLRVRGEYAVSQQIRVRPRELPPRARRIPTALPNFDRFFGTTSACAENTNISTSACKSLWNYLRVRGEYRRVRCRGAGCSELPPRARRIRAFTQLRQGVFGTTSACAENTLLMLGLPAWWWNYLRVRGEYPSVRLAAKN